MVGRPLALALALIAAGACTRVATPRGTAATLRPACEVGGVRAGLAQLAVVRAILGKRWDGAACVARTGPLDIAAGAAALARFEVETAVAALDRGAAHPLDHASHVRLWEQRGIARAYLELESDARAAFTTLLALDPGHVLSYDLSPKATFLFEQARAAARARATPALDLTWPRDLRLGAPVSVEVETVADPDRQLARATIYVRTHGERSWRAAEVDLAAPGGFRRLVLPPVLGTRPTSLDLYAVASDARGNEVLTWASPARPRELPLRYDPPTPWYRTWWVWAAAGGVVAAGTGIAVYAVLWQPSDELDGDVHIR